MWKTYTKKLIIIKQIAPGIPSIPTIIAVKKLSPIWNPHAPPIKFISIIIKTPSMELNTNFIIHFIGTMNIFPIINKKHIHAKKIIVDSIFSIPFEAV